MRLFRHLTLNKGQPVPQKPVGAILTRPVQQVRRVVTRPRPPTMRGGSR